MNYKEFKKLSVEEQKSIQKEFIYYLCELNLPSDEILNKLEIPYSTFRIFKKIFNVNRTKEQEYKLKVESRKDKQDEIVKKIKQTKLERYGNENYRNDEKIKQTCIERYGVENPYAAKEIIEKKKQTYLEHYGYDSPMKNPEFIKEYREKRLLKNNGNWNNNPKQIIQTNLEKYGAPNTWVLSTHSSISKLNYSFADLLSSFNIDFTMEFRINNKRYDF